MTKASYCLNAVFILFFIWYFGVHKGVGRYYEKYFPHKDAFLTSPDYQARVNAYRALNAGFPHTQKYVVFAGDSLIEHFPVHELFPRMNVLNRGIGYDTTVGLLKRIDVNLNNLPISDCFIMIGHNDLKYRCVDELYRNVELILSRINADRIHFMSVLPGSDVQLNARKRVLNNKVQKLSENGSFEYIDVASLFVNEDGKVRDKYFYDGIHLTVDGYRLIRQSIEKKLHVDTSG